MSDGGHLDRITDHTANLTAPAPQFAARTEGQREFRPAYAGGVPRGGRSATNIWSPVRFQLDAHPVTDRIAELLLASEVAFGGLDRDVPKQKLNLIQLAAGEIA